MSKEIVLHSFKGTSIGQVDRELAGAKDEGLEKRGKTSRISDLYIGRYGELGFVELSLAMGQPELAGILEVPGSLVKAMRERQGMIAIVSGAIFEVDGDFTTSWHSEENLQHPSLKGVTLFDSQYYWHPCRPYKYVEPHEFTEEIKAVEKQVKETIVKFDSLLDGFTPEDRRPTYSSLLGLGPGKLQDPI